MINFLIRKGFKLSMGLLSELKSGDKKGLFDSNDTYVNYPTGILPLDYANGFWQEVHYPDGRIEHEPVLGIIGGTFLSIIAPTGCGKAQPDDSMIPTPNGEIRLDQLKVGDLVFSVKGTHTPIIGIYPQGNKDIYEITFDDGRKTRCSENHLWNIRTEDDKHYVTKELREFMPDYIIDGKYKYLTPMCPILQYTFKDVPIDPWVLGVLLMRIDATKDILTIISSDDSLPDTVAKRCHWTYRKTENEYSFESIDDGPIITKEFLESIPEIVDNRSGDFRIPLDYLYNSEAVRMDVLRGIGDASDAQMKTAPNLADDIAKLMRSVGFKAYTRGFEYSRTDVQLSNLRIVKIEKIGNGPQRCIFVADSAHLYITEGYIVTHNTTLADQIGYNIIKNFNDGLMFHIDAERTALKQRIAQITGADINDERISLKEENTSVEDVLEMITKICDIKENGGDTFKYVPPNHTYMGETYKAYIPTVFIIDSVVSFNSKEYSVEDLGTNMDGARSAKTLTRFVNNCLDRMHKYNITIIMISHIRPKVEANPYSTSPPGIMMLKPGEAVPGGINLQYMCQNFFRINMNKSNAYTKDDVGFSGFKASVQIAKSKTNCIGTVVDVAFNTKLGFDPIYTLFEYASSIGLIQGRNPYLYIQGLDTMKFSRKDFRRKFMEEKEFRDAFFTIIKPHLEMLLGSKEITTDDRMRYGDLFPEDEQKKMIGSGIINSEPVKVKKAK